MPFASVRAPQPYLSYRRHKGIQVPWTVILAQPLQNIEMPALRCRRAGRYVPRAGFVDVGVATSAARPLQHLRCPPSAAPEHVYSFHGQSLARAHCRISKCPPIVAAQHVSASHGSPFSCKTFNSSSCRARSAGSSKYSGLKMWERTRWSGRPGKASPVLAALASRRARLRARARVSTPSIALEDMGGVCASLWRERIVAASALTRPSV